MPGYQKLADRYVARGFVALGFKFDTMPDMEDPLRFANSIRVHYPLAVATDDLKQRFGGIEGLPTTMVYDRHGILRMKVVGWPFAYFNNQAGISVMETPRCLGSHHSADRHWGSSRSVRLPIAFKKPSRGCYAT